MNLLSEGILYALCLLAVIFGISRPASASAPEKKSSASLPQLLEDVPEPLVRKTPSESQRDQLEAVALFSAGRMHQHREQYADALRCYERALRLDPKSATIARAIVPVALELKHYGEAVRYALKAVKLEDADPVLLRRLGTYLSDEGDWAGALSLYEKAVAAKSSGKPTAADLLLRMEMGRLYCLTGQYRKAADCFAAVLRAVDGANGDDAIDPSLAKVLLGRPGSTYQLMGECFLEANRPKEAKTVFDKAEKVTPDKALHQFNLARVLAKTHKPAEALAAIEASFAAKLTDQGEAPYETLADVLKQLGQSEQLIPRLEKLQAANPKDAALGYYLAAQYQRAKQFDQAERLCLKQVRAKPSLAGYRRLMEIDRQAKRYDALLAVLGEALDKNSALEILGAESQLLSSDAESMREIVQVARQQLKSSSDEFGYGKRLAVALLSLEAKQYETAAEFFDLAMKAKDWPKEPENKLASPPSRKAELLMAWGVGLLLGDRAAEAARVFQRAVDEKALPDDNPSFYFYLAGALAMSDRVDEALAAARTAAEKKPDSARMRGREAWVLYIGKRYEAARKAYEKLLDAFDADHVSPETRQVLREARLSLSNLCVLDGDLVKAEEWLEQVLDEFPDDVGAMNDLGYLWADQNRRLGRAERMIRKAVDAEPENAAYRDSLGWVLYRQGRLPEAIVELEKATAAPKPDGVVLDHLGDAYQKMNQHEKAVATWRKAVDALRRDKDADKAAAVEKKISNP